MPKSFGKSQVSGYLSKAASIIEEHGWDARYDWKKMPGDGLSIQQAVERACDTRGLIFDACLNAVRRAINPQGMKSIADFEDAKGRTAADVAELLRQAATIELGGDPRGPCAHLHIPGERGDGFGDGFAIY